MAFRIAGTTLQKRTTPFLGWAIGSEQGVTVDADLKPLTSRVCATGAGSADRHWGKPPVVRPPQSL